MIRKALASLTLIISLIWPIALCANSSASNNDAKRLPQHAITMHGQPKYQEDFLHLDYANPDAPKGGTLTQSASGSFDTLNPYNIKGVKASGLTYLYDPLMRRVWDEPFGLYGLIAESVEIAPDRSEITYTLNPDARFHDGSQITSEDVAFSFEMHKTHGKPVTRQVYGLVKEVDIQSPRRIRFVFGEGYDAETAMILSIMRIVPKSYWHDKDFAATTLEPPLGNGPYKVSSLDPGRQITYERVQDYWAADLPVNKGHYNYDRLVYDYFRDNTVAFQALKAGAIDIWREQDIARWITGYNSTKDISQNAFKHGRPEWLKALIPNGAKPLFEEKSVRQALWLAFPYEWVNKNLYHDAYEPITSLFPNSELAADNAFLKSQLNQPQRTRLRQANQLLQKAGWRVKDGILQKDGQIFTFEILLNNPEDEKIALTYKRNLSRLGIDASVRAVDSAQFLGRLNEFDYDMVFYRWINSLSPGNEQAIYWGTAAADQFGTRNYARVKDQEVDDAIHALVNAVSRAELIDAARKLDRKVLEDYRIIPLFYAGKDLIATRPSIAIPENTPVYGPVIETWWKQ